MRSEEHFGQFVPRKIITCPEEVHGRLFLQKVHGNFFGLRAKMFSLVFSNRYLRVRIINLDRIGTLKASKQFPHNQKLASKVFVRSFLSIPAMLHRCRIVVSLMNRSVFLMTTLMNHQC